MNAFLGCESMDHEGRNPTLPVIQVQETMEITIPNGATTSAGRAGPGSWQQSTTAAVGNRILCPVVGCPESLATSNRFFKNFASIRTHLNDHCTGQRSGVVPLDFLNHHNYSQCNVCDKILAKCYRGTCPKCRPRLQTQQRLNYIRGQFNSPSNSQNTQSTQNTPSLPSLDVILKRFVPTIKNIPKGLRRLFAQCLAKSLAQAVWTNSISSWTELLMLPKCTLCRPARGGRSHLSQRLAWTRGRLIRWVDGERSQLWEEMP